MLSFFNQPPKILVKHASVPKNVSVRSYYKKRAPKQFSGFSVDNIGGSIFITISKSPCSYYRTQAIGYLNTFVSPKAPTKVYFMPLGNTKNFTTACYKTYTLK
jgi:hypothetical protein